VSLGGLSITDCCYVVYCCKLLSTQPYGDPEAVIVQVFVQHLPKHRKYYSMKVKSELYGKTFTLSLFGKTRLPPSFHVKYVMFKD